MAAPALKDLPKVAENLKSQLESFNTENLKNANTQEKIILPTAEGEQKEERKRKRMERIQITIPLTCVFFFFVFLFVCRCGRREDQELAGRGHRILQSFEAEAHRDSGKEPITRQAR